MSSNQRQGQPLPTLVGGWVPEPKPPAAPAQAQPCPWRCACGPGQCYAHSQVTTTLCAGSLTFDFSIFPKFKVTRLQNWGGGGVGKSPFNTAVCPCHGFKRMFSNTCGRSFGNGPACMHLTPSLRLLIPLIFLTLYHLPSTLGTSNTELSQRGCKAGIWTARGGSPRSHLETYKGGNKDRRTPFVLLPPRGCSLQQ